jgi:hypothetical protein
VYFIHGIFIIRGFDDIIFLNLVVDDEKVVSYKMTRAFSKLKKAQNALNGRDLHTLLELFKYITENPEPSERPFLSRHRLNSFRFSPAGNS